MSFGKETRNRFAIQNWLMTQVAESAGVEVSEIDPREPFASYGLSSVAAISLTADLEDWLEVSLDPTLAWDYPTIEALSSYLSGNVSRVPAEESGGQETSTFRELS
jgi:acyl carrier protein